MTRQRVVGVGPGTEERRELGGVLGRWLAVEGWSLLTGAGRGAMTSATRAFCAVHGRHVPGGGRGGDP